MLSYILKRIIWMIPTFLGITLLTFIFVRLSPNSHQMLNEFNSTSNFKISIVKLDFDYTKLESELLKPENQLKIKLSNLQSKFNNYASWLDNLIRMDFGNSIKDGRPVIEKIKRALIPTLSLNILSLILIFSISVPLGLWTAKHQGQKLEKLIMIKLFLMYSLPSFWIAHLMIVYLAGADYLNAFPLGGLHSFGYENLNIFQQLCDTLWHVFLPVLTMSLASIAFLTRFTHESVSDVLNKAFVRTAYAKGLKTKRIWTHHVLRNAMIAFVTLLGTWLPSLLGGSVIIEKMFSIPGMGSLAFESALSRDYTVIMALTAISAIVTLVAMLLQDLVYVILDPRIRLSEESV